MDDLLSVKQVADLLQIPERTMYHLIKTSRGPKTYKFSRHIRVQRADLNEWVREHIQQKSRTATVQGDRSMTNTPSKEINHDQNNI